MGLFRSQHSFEGFACYLQQAIELQNKQTFKAKKISLSIAGYPPVQGSWSLSFLRHKHLLPGKHPDPPKSNLEYPENTKRL